MKLAIIGSRNFNDYQTFSSKVGEFVEKYGKPKMIISGGAMGADIMAEKWAKENCINNMIIYPNWEKHGRMAGILRNTYIVKEATHILAFPSKKGMGIQDTIKKGIKARKIIEIHFIDEI